MFPRRGSRRGGVHLELPTGRGLFSGRGKGALSSVVWRCPYPSPSWQPGPSICLAAPTGLVLPTPAALLSPHPLLSLVRQLSTVTWSNLRSGEGGRAVQSGTEPGHLAQSQNTYHTAPRRAGPLPAQPLEFIQASTRLTVPRAEVSFPFLSHSL